MPLGVSTLKSQTECTCDGTNLLTENGAFWCERHQVWKTQHWRELCLTRPGYWNMWEKGYGPGQNGKPERTHTVHTKRPPRGPGDFLRKMLGCSQRGWPYFSAMNKEGAECDVDTYTDKLSEYAKMDRDKAARLVRMAVEKFERVE